MNFNASKLLVLVGVICFVLAVFHVNTPIDLIALGLAFCFSSQLVG
jgi:hypothetical protein